MDNRSAGLYAALMPGRPWTKKELAAVSAMLDDGQTCRAIGAELGRSINAIRHLSAERNRPAREKFKKYKAKKRRPCLNHNRCGNYLYSTGPHHRLCSDCGGQRINLNYLYE